MSVAPELVGSLAAVPVGQTAVVNNITGADAITARLLEMGIIPGTSITRVGAAPLGDPLEFEVRGYRLSLRRDEAQRVKVQAATAE